MGTGAVIASDGARAWIVLSGGKNISQACLAPQASCKNCGSPAIGAGAVVCFAQYTLGGDRGLPSCTGRWPGTLPGL